MDVTNLTRVQKAAVVIVSLGSENASNVYKYLHEEEIEQITFEIARLRNLSPEETERVLNEFYQLCVTQKVFTDGGVEYARTVLEKAF